MTNVVRRVDDDDQAREEDFEERVDAARSRWEFSFTLYTPAQTFPIQRALPLRHGLRITRAILLSLSLSSYNPWTMRIRALGMYACQVLRESIQQSFHAAQGFQPRPLAHILRIDAHANAHTRVIIHGEIMNDKLDKNQKEEKRKINSESCKLLNFKDSLRIFMDIPITVASPFNAE